MPDAAAALRQLLVEIESRLLLVNRLDVGYPLGENLIKPLADKLTQQKLITITGMPTRSSLAQFFSLCDGIVASDVYNGYWIHQAELIIHQFVNGEPIRMTTPISANILVIGSDGGGGRFAIDRDNWSDVYYLLEGKVIEATFAGSEGSVELRASNFVDFIGFLRDEIATFLNRKCQ